MLTKRHRFRAYDGIYCQKNGFWCQSRNSLSEFGCIVVCDLKILSHMTTYLGVYIIQVVDQVNICKNWTVWEGGIDIIMSLVLHILMLHCDCDTAEQGKF